MPVIKLILEGLGLGFLLYLICAIGIRNGAIGMVHLYDQKVQERVIRLGMTTQEAIRRRGAVFIYFFILPPAFHCRTMIAITLERTAATTAMPTVPMIHFFFLSEAVI